jgi:opacity protein-like surface antigen
MKKGFLVGALLLSAGAVSAQNLYVGVQAGYGMGTPGDVLGTTTVVSSTGDQTTTNIYGSLGGGANVGLNVGYMFTEHLGAELGFNYFLGSSVTTTDVTVPTGNATLMAKSTQMRILPSLIVTTGGDFAVYGKAGLVLPAGGSTVAEYRDDTNPLAVVAQDFESKGALSLGFQGAIGVSYNLSDKLTLTGELSGVNMRIKGASRTTTLFTVNDTDILSGSDTYDKEVTYVDELNSSSNNSAYNSNYSTSQAKESLATTTNFNGVFFNVGLKFNF